MAAATYAAQDVFDFSGGAVASRRFVNYARDSVTGALYTWVNLGSAPDTAGGSYPGPNSPTDYRFTEA